MLGRSMAVGHKRQAVKNAHSHLPRDSTERPQLIRPRCSCSVSVSTNTLSRVMGCSGNHGRPPSSISDTDNHITQLSVTGPLVHPLPTATASPQYRPLDAISPAYREHVTRRHGVDVAQRPDDLTREVLEHGLTLAQPAVHVDEPAEAHRVRRVVVQERHVRRDGAVRCQRRQQRRRRHGRDDAGWQ